ncbi:MAG: molybdate ABC transporter permease subunit [Rhodospirillales bacterium]|mgnify:CR=1 FL=1|jgi:molybdate transport system permease protein|nr:molybdate ABC transporter permease subunit [Rhodospirillaceae bacterium]MDP6430548.1 molybdate ABC transporter permease subunit [Rhodospirillales bacterium]MDP6644011.1 molybdate ABC transporter permease subunit [Rhodospirillales bacterium]MDP6841232.1 molybdate ABC transporter permease subunit [Rhodospirillales bacterium]|tara:strand:+ start:5443 stop:6135 length:693 start_codon:yes stop_codon:yes gene_type:complete
MWELSATEAEAIGLSLKVAFWAVLVSIPLGVCAAWLLARRRFVGHSVFNGLIHLPLVLPPVVIGYLLLVLFGKQGPLGAFLFDVFGITVAFTWKGAAIASGVMAFPLMVRAIRLSYEGVDQRLEAAARTLGAGRFRVFATITLPLIAPGILVGTILAFARSLGEFGATITFVSNIPGETRTLPLAIFTEVQTPGADATAIRLVIISVVIALVALILSEFLARRVNKRLGS